jgi:hypothetical protein
MALMPVNIDPGVAEGLLVGTIGIVAAVVAVIAAIMVARQARGGSAEEDQELLSVMASRLSMTVSGGGRMSDPLNLQFVFTDPAITLFQIELSSPLDKRLRTAPCVKAAPGIFNAAVEPRVVERWYNANGYWEGETKKLPIRVLFEFGGQAAQRTIWVTMSPVKSQRPGLPNDMDFTWLVEGPCSRSLPAIASVPRRTRIEKL